MRVVTLFQDTANTSSQFFYTVLSEVPRYPELDDLLELHVGMVGGIGNMMERYQADGVLA